MRSKMLLSGLVVLSLNLPVNAFAQSASSGRELFKIIDGSNHVPNVNDTRIAPPTIAPEFAKFTPNPKSQVKIDYEFLDQILNNLVFLTGLSTRQIAPKPVPLTGSRFIAEHTSPYRQEGNKIPFSKLGQEHVAILQEYKRELEDLNASVDIATLSRKEQLAYWLNLHNVTVIMLIAENYPVAQPSKMKIGPDKVPMHDAKVISVGGTMLSLRDIRENIVFPNWQDPKVIYGFFQGDIGSPTLQGQAFTAANTEKLLNQNADEFINSLRSFSRGGVSKIYKEAAPFYFNNFEQDLRDHFQSYMWDDVSAELAETRTLKINSYDYDVADMEGGRGPIVIGNVSVDGKPVKDSQSYAIASYTNQIRDKTQILLRQGKINRGEVTVGDEEPVAETGESPDESENK